MAALVATPWTTWSIAALATAGVILRPMAWPEWIWAIAGAALIVALGLLPWHEAVAGVGKGTDVYLFLVGMMLLAELARKEGLFDWLAARAVRIARGSPGRLFALVYAVGTVVTVFLSNDAAAVVLTPAVAAAATAAKVREPLPFLFVCAFIANAASFVLPISNPANLVIYGSHMPPLLQWLPRFALPSLLSIVTTFAVLRWTQQSQLQGRIESEIQVPGLSTAGKLAAAGIGFTAIVLLTASFLDLQLGLPTFLAGAATAVLVLTKSKNPAAEVLKDISWGVLPLVAGLFVLVEALVHTGVTEALARLLHLVGDHGMDRAAWGAGLLLAFGVNAVNNLPAGLVASSVVHAAHPPAVVVDALLIGVDLGPNLSITGSLATILWLTAIRREGEEVGFWRFLKVGALVMPPALVLSVAARLLLR